MGRFAILLLLVGCYSPSVAPGAPCSSEGTCPSGLMCLGGRCVVEPGPIDGATDSAVDAVIDAPSDGLIDAPPDVMIDAGPNATWSTPTKVPGVNSTSTEADPSFTSNRLMIAFTRNDEIYIGTRAELTDNFTVAVATDLNSPAEEQSPELSPDGMTIYFTSERLVAADLDIYTSTRSGGTWSTPVRVDALSTTSNDEGDIALSPDGMTMVFVRNGAFYRSSRLGTTWLAPIQITGTFGTSEAAPSLTAAGDLYYHAGTTRDLYVARPQGTLYGTPINITELNTTGRDASPFVSPDERHIMFEREGEIYEAFR